uniref:Uncharacterized protein n=1 Tax=Candidatus Kentrum sp. FW TaxID=2126338 RepID=A0A450U0T0_9GAMM|nr:MAG: hypothetical protein BECKFW1821C_GA0114237_109011 [Candidatus Kentron sp. FW]
MPIESEWIADIASVLERIPTTASWGTAYATIAAIIIAARRKAEPQMARTRRLLQAVRTENQDFYPRKARNTKKYIRSFPYYYPSISCFWCTFFIPRFSIELLRCFWDRRVVLSKNTSDVKNAEYNPVIPGAIPEQSGMDRWQVKNRLQHWLRQDPLISRDGYKKIKFQPRFTNLFISRSALQISLVLTVL